VVVALVVVEAVEVNAGEGEDANEDAAFFNMLAANNEATTRNDHTQEAVEHIQAESDVV
jgi:hypothetical protein